MRNPTVCRSSSDSPATELRRCPEFLLGDYTTFKVVVKNADVIESSTNVIEKTPHVIVNVIETPTDVIENGTNAIEKLEAKKFLKYYE